MKLYIVLISLLFSIKSMGQIKDIITADSSVVVDRLYAGMLSSTSFDVREIRTVPSVNFRVGARVAWKVNNSVTVRSFGMIQTDLSKTTGLQALYIDIRPVNKCLVSIGQMPTLSTEQRPLPVSAGGQFETWTQSRVPGAAPGAKVKYLPSRNMSVGIGIAGRGALTEYYMSLSHSKLSLSLYHRSDGQDGAALSYDGKKFYGIGVVVGDSLIATTLVYNFSKGISLFGDVGYYTHQRTMPRAEAGVMKKYSARWFSGLLSLTYDVKNKSVNGYFFIHL